MKKETLGNILALAFGIFIVAVIVFSLETFLRFKYTDPMPFYYSVNPKLINHVELFKRSPIPKPTDPYPRVFCLGGSTTNGCNMPIQYSYPNLLDAIMKKEKAGGSAYNFGISGVNSVTTNFFVKNLLSEYKPNCVVLHDGYNDLPIVIKKTGDDSYLYITPDYNKPFNPYIKNPVIRYAVNLVKFNLRATRRFLVTFVKNRLKGGGDLFLGFDYTKYPKHEGNTNDLMAENKKRMEIMIKTELDTIDYCLANGIKVVVILEPYIKPLHFAPHFGTGFRDENVGMILSECHKIQQSFYLIALASKYRDNPNIIILDMREIFAGKYDELFYDECHLNGKGNFIKAQIVYSSVKKLFGLNPESADGVKP